MFRDVFVENEIHVRDFLLKIATRWSSTSRNPLICEHHRYSQSPNGLHQCQCPSFVFILIDIGSWYDLKHNNTIYTCCCYIINILTRLRSRLLINKLLFLVCAWQTLKTSTPYRPFQNRIGKLRKSDAPEVTWRFSTNHAWAAHLRILVNKSLVRPEDSTILKFSSAVKLKKYSHT